MSRFLSYLKPFALLFYFLSHFPLWKARGLWKEMKKPLLHEMQNAEGTERTSKSELVGRMRSLTMR